MRWTTTSGIAAQQYRSERSFPMASYFREAIVTFRTKGAFAAAARLERRK
jgi:hypothetical protein